jgi:hypothetical protein
MLVLTGVVLGVGWMLLYPVIRSLTAKKSKTAFETFRLFTSGPDESNICATVSGFDIEAAEHSIQGMKSLVRDKKMRHS